MGARNKIPTEHGDYYHRHWLVVRDGGSDQWLYVCKDGVVEEGKGCSFFFIDINDMPSCCGRDATYRWDVSVSVVDILGADKETIQSSMRYVGFEGELDMKLEQDRLQLAEMLFEHGAKSPVWNDGGGKITFDDYGNANEPYDENCPEFRRLRKEAREFCEETLFDEASRNHLLDTKIVNGIGQTAREFAGGTQSLWETLRRIKTQGEDATPEQRLVLKMYGKAGQTLGAGPVPADLLEVDSDG